MTTASVDAPLRSTRSRSVPRAVPAHRRTVRVAPCDSLATCSVLPTSADRGPGPVAGIATMLSPAALCGLLLLLA